MRGMARCLPDRSPRRPRGHRSLPGLPRQLGDQGPVNLLSSLFQVPVDPWSEAGAQVLHEDGIRELRRKIGVEFSPGNSGAGPVYVLQEALHNSFGARSILLKGDPEIEEVATLSPLIERPQLGSQELVEA